MKKMVSKFGNIDALPIHWISKAGNDLLYSKTLFWSMTFIKNYDPL